ncbi:MAG: protein-methionine-sulfoxide reductase catalytic subunit MsrP [Deltaproteobacteria bacterium]|nr:protein-methionine-sulfoxide reductase catalytic subunit MsrP [Deltaproteobacteria bacterium]
MLIKKTQSIRENEVTSQEDYLRRRDFLKSSAIAGSMAAVGLPLLSSCMAEQEATAESSPSPVSPLSNVIPAPPQYSIAKSKITPEWEATHYNNFYELGTSKEDPARNAHFLKTKPWSVAIEGEVEKPGQVPLETLLRPHPLEERIYRLRCVEAWSMVIPWIGIPLGQVLKQFNPTSKARYVAFETLYDPKQLPGQKTRALSWPYREGLRIDEAMNPLTLLAVGMYGNTLPGQNGAPIRLVVPWKYGFKSIKSIVKIRLQEDQPMTSWNDENSREYGFYANVNPEVSHPRWSQARERRIGDWTKRPTLPFNGYADEVAGLYAGMDLRRSF